MIFIFANTSSAPHNASPRGTFSYEAISISGRLLGNSASYPDRASHESRRGRGACVTRMSGESWPVVANVMRQAKQWGRHTLATPGHIRRARYLPKSGKLRDALTRISPTQLPRPRRGQRSCGVRARRGLRSSVRAEQCARAPLIACGTFVFDTTRVALTSTCCSDTDARVAVACHLFASAQDVEGALLGQRAAQRRADARWQQVAQALREAARPSAHVCV